MFWQYMVVVKGPPGEILVYIKTKFMYNSSFFIIFYLVPPEPSGRLSENKK